MRRSDYPADSILFMGSSSIRLWDTLARDMAPYPVIQRGYGGAKFQDLAVFAERIVDPHEFRAVVIFVANDIVGKDSDLKPEEVAALYKEVVATVREKDAESPVFLIAITPTKSRWQRGRRSESQCGDGGGVRALENLAFHPTEDAFLRQEAAQDRAVPRRPAPSQRGWLPALDEDRPQGAREGLGAEPKNRTPGSGSS